MLEENSDCNDGNGSYWARVCDACWSAACTVYCKVDLTYLCASCDVRVHEANQVASCHERVRVCDSCERAPAAFLCKADAASLCSTCDANIHSANPLAQRHHRVPIMPISRSMYDIPPKDEGETTLGHEAEIGDVFGEEGEEETASWLLPNPGKSSINNNNQKNGFLFGGEGDEYIDFVEYNSSAENQFTDQYNQQNYSVPQKNHGSDSVVPVQYEVMNLILLQQQQPKLQVEMDYETSKAHYSCNSSTSQTVSVSSMGVGVVPESTMSDISISQTIPYREATEVFTGTSNPMPPHLSPMDREARVLRYREKKKTRKFEKTIRYASRKAYAEIRPRIKGRFAKRTDVETEDDHIFSKTLIAETEYGIVPSF